MRKLAVILILVFLMGCAHGRTSGHYPNHPDEYKVVATLGWLLKRNNIPISEIKYQIWKNPDINAAVGDNVIIVTTGLLDALPRDNHAFLSAVIAHELAHYKLGHQLKGKTFDTVTQIGVGAITIATAAITGIPFLDVAGDATSSAICNTYNRAQEYEADLLAVELLRKADYLNAKQDMADMFRWFEKVAPQTNLYIWNSHPMPQDRIKNILESK